MNSINFTWDPTKAISNLKKHSISFDEAISVFYDSFARLVPDPDHSASEERFIILGMSKGLRVLAVVHCYRDNENTIRLISARKATSNETKQYKEFLP